LRDDREKPPETCRNDEKWSERANMEMFLPVLDSIGQITALFDYSRLFLAVLGSSLFYGVWRMVH